VNPERVSCSGFFLWRQAATNLNPIQDEAWIIAGYLNDGSRLTRNLKIKRGLRTFEQTRLWLCGSPCKLAHDKDASTNAVQHPNKRHQIIILLPRNLELSIGLKERRPDPGVPPSPDTARIKEPAS
jgi:hypothetical protein